MMHPNTPEGPEDPEARRRLQAMYGDAEGAADAMRLALASGLPLPQILLSHADSAVPAARGRVLGAVEAAIPYFNAHGCFEAKFAGRDGGEVEARILLDRCGPDHDLGAELGRIDPRVTDAARQKVRECMSALVWFGRRTLRMAVDALPHDVAGAIPPLIIDPTNTTFYLAGYPDVRVGLFVRPPDGPAR